MKQPNALFLDRDGVINVDRGYVHKVEDFEFVEGIFEVARWAHNAGMKVIVVTNQAGIARGYYSEAQFGLLTDWMCQQFVAAGAPIDRTYYSPFHPTAGLGRYLKDDISRKPKPGMILAAQVDFNLDLGASILIGDAQTDMEAGIAAGVGTNLLISEKSLTSTDASGYAVFGDLGQALAYLISSGANQK